MKTKKILILGRQGVGKTQLANLLSKALGIPITEEVECLGKLPNEEGIYTSNSIPIEVANVGLPQGFMLIQIKIDMSELKIGDIVPYKNSRSNIKLAQITSFKTVENGKVWFNGIDTETKAKVWYPVHISQTLGEPKCNCINPFCPTCGNEVYE